jgi:uncharacterized peroxidase-related enzyme
MQPIAQRDSCPHRWTKMPYIKLPEGLSGIIAGFAFRPATARPMREFAEALLRAPSPLSLGDRELIATLVSTLNRCEFCTSSHRAAAAHHFDGNYDLVDRVRADHRAAPISEKLKALLTIAERCVEDGRNVTPTDVGQARAAGATDLEIHDAVLIAAAFCLFNRYVDGLAMPGLPDDASYDQVGSRLSKAGYLGF